MQIGNLRLHSRASLDLPLQRATVNSLAITPDMAETGLRLSSALVPSQRVFADAILPRGAPGVAAAALPVEVAPADAEFRATKAAETLAKGADGE